MSVSTGSVNQVIFFITVPPLLGIYRKGEIGLNFP